MKKTKNSYLYDADGYGVIKMAVYDDNDFLSPYSVRKESVINSEVAKFLDNSVNPINSKTPLKIKIYSDCITTEEQSDYRNGIINYYKNRLFETNLHLKRSLVVALILLILAFVFLAVAIVMQKFQSPEILCQLVNIAGWVFAWEAVYEFFLRRQSKRIQKKREISFINSKIEFYSLKDM